MLVYLITNVVNGNQYVGQTIKKLEHRWNQHVYDSKLLKYPIHKAFYKYGKDNFTIDVLHTCESKEEMDFVETFYIQFLGTKSPHGYNVLDGASITGAHAGHKHSEDTKKKFSKQRVGRTAWNKGMKMSPDYCETARKSHLGVKWKEGRKRWTRKSQLEKALGLSLKKFLVLVWWYSWSYNCFNSGRIMTSVCKIKI